MGGPSGDFWTDREVRRSALRDLRDALRFGGADDVQSAADAIDGHIVAALESLGFPRGPARPSVERQGSVGNRAGVKRPNCLLLIEAHYVEQHADALGNPDSVVRTWVHESIHARLEFAASAMDHEWFAWKGYEEGLAEGLARLITRDIAGLSPETPVYTRYVMAYEALARVLGQTPEELWRALYPIPFGAVRDTLPEVVARLSIREHPPRPSLVRATADELFNSGDEGRSVPSLELEEQWREALR